MAAAAQTQSQSAPRLVLPSLPSQSAHRVVIPPSHDTSLAGYHVTQRALLLQLDLAVKASWATRHQMKYADVRVLMMSWDSDDLGVEKEINILKSVFQDAYNYADITHWKIPDKRPGQEALERVRQFFKQGDQADNLLIVYYAGHAMPNVNHHGLPTRFVKRQSNSPKFDSSAIQAYLCEVDDTSPDVLFLYDTCHSANGHGSIDSSRSAIALLAACGFESVAAEIGSHSFTYALIQELSDAARQRKAISVPQLHSCLLNRLHLQRQDVLLHEKDGQLRIRTTQDGVPLFELPVWRTPIYIQLSRNARPRPIMLAPLPRKTTSTSNDLGYIPLSSEPMNSDKSTAPKKRQMQVLLRVSLAEDSFNMEEFKEWICDAPEPADDIKIITTLPSCSTLVLIQMPVELWVMLPASPAISFVGSVSINEAHQSRSSYMSMSSKPPSVSGLSAPNSTSDDDKSTAAVLDTIDSILPPLFTEIRQGAVGDDTFPATWDVVDQAIGKLEQAASNSVPRTACVRASSLSQKKTLSLARRYIAARYILEQDSPLLNLARRLNAQFSSRNHDAEAPVDLSTILSDTESVKSDPKMSSIFSDAKTIDTALTSLSSSSYSALLAASGAHRSSLETDQAGMSNDDAVPSDDTWMDSRYRVESGHRFMPGQVFKSLWSEPQTSTKPS